MFRWRKAKGICVKWRNCLKNEGMGKRSPTMSCSLVKYIMLFERSVDNRTSSFVSWIGIMLGIWKRARNSCSDKTPTRQFGRRRPTLVFFYPSCWGFPLVEVTPHISIKLSASRLCGNLYELMQLLKPITQVIYRLALPLQYINKPKQTIVWA